MSRDFFPMPRFPPKWHSTFFPFAEGIAVKTIRSNFIKKHHSFLSPAKRWQGYATNIAFSAHTPHTQRALLLFSFADCSKCALVRYFTSGSLSFQVDVVEAAHTVMKAKLETVRDFVSLQRAHQEMLSTLRAKFYLDNLDISQVQLWQIKASPFAGRYDHSYLRTRYMVAFFFLPACGAHIFYDEMTVEQCDIPVPPQQSPKALQYCSYAQYYLFRFPPVVFTLRRGRVPQTTEWVVPAGIAAVVPASRGMTHNQETTYTHQIKRRSASAQPRGKTENGVGMS